eukprot:m.195136 g.195136  ORF g.195136 m.195136 type:complete len:65 (+) comp32549_c0_seq1:2235-2429(+)
MFELTSSTDWFCLLVCKILIPTIYKFNAQNNNTLSCLPFSKTIATVLVQPTCNSKAICENESMQ